MGHISRILTKQLASHDCCLNPGHYVHKAHSLRECFLGILGHSLGPVLKERCFREIRLREHHLLCSWGPIDNKGDLWSNVYLPEASSQEKGALDSLIPE